MPTQGAWISIFTEEVWQDPVRNKNRRAFPLTRPASVMAGLIKEGDLIIDYMKGRNCIVGVAQVTTRSQSGTQTRRSPVRYDNNYELGGRSILYTSKSSRSWCTKMDFWFRISCHNFRYSTDSKGQTNGGVFSAQPNVGTMRMEKLFFRSFNAACRPDDRIP